ncbi:MAG: 2-amino-4-hydroxy-6-hydroxymethyldihydropteridine diphosphokinase [Bacteroidota bacterium]
MENVFLLTGSNLGDRKAFLDYACREMKKKLIMRSLSSLYESEPWGYSSDMPYLNQCMKVNTDLEPYDLLAFLQEIEKSVGRTKKGGKYEDRPLDMDILYYGKLIIQSEKLIIPHPRLHLRAFTLVPLNEIAPLFKHPVFMKTSAELLRECRDEQMPRKIE